MDETLPCGICVFVCVHHMSVCWVVVEGGLREIEWSCVDVCVYMSVWGWGVLGRGGWRGREMEGAMWMCVCVCVYMSVWRWGGV